MAATNFNKHLTLDERRIIANGISAGSPKSHIASVLGKDKSTIGKEIKAHRILTHRFNLPLECSNYRHCKHGRHCPSDCLDYIPFVCKRRDRSPGACNGCSQFTHCRFNKFIYKPELADVDYRTTLVDSRTGVNLSCDEAKKMATIIKPLLDQGHSPYHIIHTHPELGITERTLYTYIEDGIFAIAGITQMDLRRQVSRKIPKNRKNTFKKREDRKYLKGRTYADYKNYLSENPNTLVVQMDTVYNDGSNGPFIQTLKFLRYGFLFAIYHEKKDSQSMLQGVDLLEEILGKELFNSEVEVLLTDRGSEFICAEAFEKRQDETMRTRVYYCDPMQSGQKGSLENNHIELRYICPKGTDLRRLGLDGQDKLNLVLSHINSMPKEKLNGKSPIELMEFLHPSLMKKFNDFGITKIEKDKVLLKPYLLK